MSSSRRRESLAFVLLSTVLALAACGGDDASPVAPQAPATDDPAYTATGFRSWYIVGNAVTPGNDVIELSVTTPAETTSVTAWIGGTMTEMTATNDGFSASIDISMLPGGDHQLLLAADSAEIGFMARTIRRSHPLYVFVSNDWDNANNSDLSLTLQERLHESHPAMVMTHFVGPYTYTDPDMSQERKDILSTWVKNMRDTYGDEVGLHIHPRCTFVDTTSVTCRSEPSTTQEAGDPTGYTVMVNAYTEAEFTTLLQEGDALLMAAGLGKPTSFRAGGWTAGITTLKALANAGYVVDGSALNWARLEEWKGVQSGVLYDWNKMQWATINETSQPYYPSADDILAPGDLDVLELPDNGILVDYVTTREMTDMFDANWPNHGPLAAPTAYNIGYHPSNFSTIYLNRIDPALSYFDGFLASDDAGPVIYANMSDAAKIWPKN